MKSDAHPWARAVLVAAVLASSGCYASHRRAEDAGPPIVVRDAGPPIVVRDAGPPIVVRDAGRPDAGPRDAGCLSPSTPCRATCCAPGDVCILRRSICCPRPYHVATPDDRCVWSCAPGTMPDMGSGECVCQPGLMEAGTDTYGRRVCG